MKKWWKNEQGLSIIELLAALTLITLIFGGATYVIFQQNIAQDTFQQATSERIELQAAIAEMKRNVENASELNAIDNRVEVIVDGNTITYEIMNGELLQQKDSQPTTLLTNVQRIELLNENLVELTVRGGDEKIQMARRLMAVSLPIVVENEDDRPIPPKADHKVTCLPNTPFKYPSNSDFSNLANQNQKIICNTTTGELSFWWGEKIALSDGSYEFDVMKTTVNAGATLVLNNGSLITNSPLNLLSSSTLEVSDSLYINADVSLNDSANKINIGKDVFTRNLTLFSHNKINIGGHMMIDGDLSLLNTGAGVFVDLDAHINGKIITRYENYVSSRDLKVKDSINIKQDSTFMISRDFYANNGLWIDANVTFDVAGNAYIKNLISFNQHWIGHTKLVVGGKFTYTGPTEHDDRGRLIQANELINVPILDLNPYFPTFPEFPQKLP
ncbi:hypothetical protein AJ85_04790 [Alkalihalobacillus alcalophilus ATCC 27647 = CGMCC 1.3604]|uniref:Uncharacterized protein n=1 Tax=Alkalihalobacillus alcalophilus ATCC 27647 = CGMCC 1.3604 TaxID=1218173 RepID=A0A094YVS6_ALKAL|nr:hypothetical protein [Alkalihalobacillus alcalophilus]KGA97622.1 hypothetical protein BALCAV_0209215 [Alkalihalobacillus alcalophilus ATCC 27647 = CGMCC 1.3604]MED1561410.1 hypothetical protein [Alkalihalobacillus alcalophilus]THG91452.1 hypothetical protein AJ85_04790 [Alkalihalobacillus alcalophilus ATCC 27647 = CGMCC 1.3604]